MKEVLTPLLVMERMVEKLQQKYPEHEYKEEGIIQFHLTHDHKNIDCYLKSDLTALKFFQGISENPTVTVKSTFYNWLDLDRKITRLNSSHVALFRIPYFA